jgi:hypothetical protein
MPLRRAERKTITSNHLGAISACFRRLQTLRGWFDGTVAQV